MCGIAGIVGQGWSRAQLEAMVAVQQHRGPDDEGIYMDAAGMAGLGHNRLSIIDLSSAGHQPMSNRDGTVWIIFNGEIYNYVELRTELKEYAYRSHTDTEVILAAYERWGEHCLDHFIGMFAFMIWDSRAQRLFAARDRFGVKPLYYHIRPDSTLLLASEIKALHAAGVQRVPDATTWAIYLTYGLYDHAACTFWKDVRVLPAGHALMWQAGMLRAWRWYDLAERSGVELDHRPSALVQEEYLALLSDSVRLRFRSDVPVAINLSGGLDSSTLLGLVQRVQGKDSAVTAFTFVTGDPNYDETPWVQQTLARTRHPSTQCLLRADEVPDLALRVQQSQDEPFGGLPTLAYSRVFQQARTHGEIVLLDGQGLDEQWAGYDYYDQAVAYEKPVSQPMIGPVQGSRGRATRPECLLSEFRNLAQPLTPPTPFPDALRNLQYRDACYTKIPRALRFNDRISMMYSTELREPFLDHRLFELALRQPPDRKIAGSQHKVLLRHIAQTLLPAGVVEAPKRPLQTPQREWLRGPLRDWVTSCLEQALSLYGGVWLDRAAVETAWSEYGEIASDNSFFIWQWISLALCLVNETRVTPL